MAKEYKVPLQEMNIPTRSDANEPTPTGTILMMVGLLLTWITLGGDTPSAVARHAAVGVGMSLGMSFWFDLKHGLRGLLRTDNIALIGLYGMTLLEFLFDQPQFDYMVSDEWIGPGVTACLVGFAGLGLGRHVVLRTSESMLRIVRQPVSNRTMLRLFFLCVAVGYFNMMLAVGFDVADMIHYWGERRFSQPWGRGRFGNWEALLYELSMVLYLLPPIGGVILARAAKYTRRQVIVVSVFVVLTLFYGFASGTRNLFGAYLITLLVAYLFALPPARLARRKMGRYHEWIVAGAAGALMFIATRVMLAFRGMGLWNYLEQDAPTSSYLQSEFFVDYNLWVITKLVEVFPRAHPFLGWEIPYLGLIRPIPRALWAGKPEGLSIPIEDVVGVQGLTLASSFVGESYMAGGLLAVGLVALFFGVVARWWNGLIGYRNSDLGVLIYASGFFAIAISMRSLFVFTTAALPTIAALLYAWWVTRHRPEPTLVSPRPARIQREAV